MTRPLPALLGVLLTLTLAGCGAEQDGAAPPTSDPAGAATSTAPDPTSGAAEAPDGIAEPPPAQEVPELLRFEAKTIEGEVFDGATLYGSPAVLWFWAPWCPTCQAEAPTIAEAARTDGVRFVGVAAQDEVPAMREFVDRFSLGSFPHLADTTGTVWRRFDVTYQPAYAFVRADGTVEVEQELLQPDVLLDRVRALR